MAATETIEVYHGCSTWSLWRILKDGLQPYRDSRRVYVTTSPVRAGVYAAYWCAHFNDRHGGAASGAMVAFKVPITALFRSPDAWFLPEEFVVRGGIPASAIAHYWIQPLDIDLTRPSHAACVRAMNEQIDAGQGGLGCPRCRNGKPATRNLAEVAFTMATPHALHSTVHGPEHWGRVTAAGVYLQENGVQADNAVVRLFTMLHDTQRHSDGRDPGHGKRAADVILEHEVTALLNAKQRDQLATALTKHSAGETTDDPTVGACWDADRLDLWRLGRRPSRKLLSTAVAQDAATIEWARDELQGQETEDWVQACRETYAAAGAR
jgi:uncharacterized protein